MREKEIQIQTPDHHQIYGVWNGSKRHRQLIVFVHGLTGHKNEHIFYNAARFFPEHGFATFRFDLYSGEKNSRSLTDCTLQTHADDLHAVLEYWKAQYKRIHVVGHSLGGPTILQTPLDPVASVVLWDPSFDILPDISKEMAFDHRIQKYIVNWGTEYLLPSAMIESWKHLGEELLPLFQKPTKIICAGKGILHKNWKKRQALIKSHHDFVVIDGAGHCFDEGNSEQNLFAETLAWVQNRYQETKSRKK